MPLERPGGRAQVIARPPPIPDGSSLAPLLAWLEQHSAEPLGLGASATEARMSTRTLSRRFVEQTGTTPVAWLPRARLRRAQALLETTTHPVDRISGMVGFGSPTAFRERFRAGIGVSPAAYRGAFRPSWQLTVAPEWLLTPGTCPPGGSALSRPRARTLAS